MIVFGHCLFAELVQVKCHMNSQHAPFLSSFGFHDHYLGEVKGQSYR